VTTKVYKLQPFWEWRFEVSFGASISVKVLSGTAEKDGTELAQQQAYRFSGIKSKILTLQGCEIEVEGAPDDDFTAEYARPEDSPMNSY
jgi:polyribonucleotide 5'-hydroxyl-kinase